MRVFQRFPKPYVGAHFEYRGMLVKVWKTSLEPGHAKNIEPGKIILSGVEGVVVKAGEGAIGLLDYEPRINFSPGSYL